MLSFYLALIDTEEDCLKFEEIYNNYGGLMYNVAYGFVKDEHFAKEVLSKAFEAIAVHITEIEISDAGRLKNFLYKTVKNHSYNLLNDKHHKARVFCLDDFEGISSADDIEMTLEGDDTYKLIVKKIRELPEAYVDVLSLYYLDELSPRIIADVLDRPIATVRSQIHRGTKILQSILKEAEIYEQE